MIAASANAEERYLYKRYSERSGESMDTSHFVISDLENGMKKYVWDNSNSGHSEITEYTLDAQGMCIVWNRANDVENTKFVVENDGAKLTIKGVLKGKAVDKALRYKDHPYYANPKIELMDFIRSGKEKVEFWTLRSDTLTTYKMIAFNKGIEAVAINGTLTRAYRIEWGPSIGMLSKYFSRVYWFRESDHIFIKQLGSNRYVRELIQETHD
jgi:hypothetical protein